MANSSSQPVASTSMITLKYSGAVVAAFMTTVGSVSLFSELFGLWTGKTGSLAVLGGYEGIVSTAVFTALSSVIAFLLYRRVTKDVAAKPGYIDKPVYHFITNGFFAVLAGALLVIVAQLVSILISSLLLIGTSTDIGGMYLNQFLPGVLAGGILGFVGFAAYKILTGKNFSSLMTIVLMSLAGALLLAVLITVPIKAHTATTSTTPSNMYDYSDYFNELYR